MIHRLLRIFKPDPRITAAYIYTHKVWCSLTLCRYQNTPYDDAKTRLYTSTLPRHCDEYVPSDVPTCLLLKSFQTKFFCDHVICFINSFIHIRYRLYKQMGRCNGILSRFSMLEIEQSKTKFVAEITKLYGKEHKL